MLSRSLFSLRLTPSVLGMVQPQREVHHHMERGDIARYLGLARSNRAKANRNTHVKERRFRKLRGQKTVMIDLPEYEEEQKLNNLPPDQLRLELLKKGINPYKDVSPRNWQEAQVTQTSFYSVIDPYVDLEEKVPLFSTNPVESGKAKFAEVKDRGLHMWHNWRNGTRRINRKEGINFSPKTFGPTAEFVYKEAHEALMSRDRKALHRVATENAFQKMWKDVETGSIKWELVEVVEPHKVVSIRCSDIPVNSGNDVAQVTVRMHTRQKLAVYDRFGKLLVGSEVETRDAVEYVVFENHISVQGSSWRLHDKVYPRWIKPKQGIQRTKVLGDGVSRPEASAPVSLEIVKKIEEQQKQEAKQSS
ncbi:unnamed protein product, partial [Mesorhabditis spiculigera]